MTNGKPRMFPGFLLNLSLFLSLAGGRRPAPTDAAAETGRWATSHRDVAAPRGEPSRQLTRGLQKAKSRLPLWGRCPPKEGGEGQVPAAPSHGLCRSAGKLPSQSRRSRASSPKGGAKSRLPLWGALVPSGHRSALDRAGRRECHAKGMTERAFPAAPAAHVRFSLAQARRSAAAQWRDLSRAVTHRELRAQALGSA